MIVYNYTITVSKPVPYLAFHCLQLILEYCIVLPYYKDLEPLVRVQGHSAMWQTCESGVSVLARWVVAHRSEPPLFIRRSLFPRDELAAIKQTVRRKYADVCSRMWVVLCAAAAVLVSLRFPQLHRPGRPGNTEVMWAALARATASTLPPIVQRRHFWRLVCGRYWERRNLIPGNLRYWKQVKSSQPCWLCIFFFCFPLKRKCNFHGSTDKLPPGQKKTWFYSSAARITKRDFLREAVFHTHLLCIFPSWSLARKGTDRLVWRFMLFFLYKRPDCDCRQAANSISHESDSCQIGIVLTAARPRQIDDLLIFFGVSLLTRTPHTRTALVEARGPLR